MKHIIKITPIDNIDFEKGIVIDNSKIENREIDGNTEVTLFNTVNEIERQGKFIHVSVYDDILVENEVKYKILHMLTK